MSFNSWPVALVYRLIRCSWLRRARNMEYDQKNNASFSMNSLKIAYCRLMIV
jgi:hypothetical protein